MSGWTLPPRRTREEFVRSSCIILTRSTENLIRGKTGHWPGGDIDFLVRYSPNHHRGLAALVTLSLKTKTPKPSGVNDSR